MVITIDMVTGVIEQDSKTPERREEKLSHRDDTMPMAELDLGLRIQPVEPEPVKRRPEPHHMPKDVDSFLDDMGA